MTTYLLKILDAHTAEHRVKALVFSCPPLRVLVQVPYKVAIEPLIPLELQ